MAKKKIKKGIDCGFSSKEAAEKLGYFPITLQRISDGRILTINSNSNYVFADQTNSYEYSYERLMDDPRAKGHFIVIGWAKNYNLNKKNEEIEENSN